MNENEYNSKMLNDTLVAIDRVVKIYENNKTVLDDLKIDKTVNQAQNLLKDIMLVNTVDAKKSLCNLLDAILADILVRVSELEKFINSSMTEIASLRGKIPMSKQQVARILRAFNFRDYADDETNAGNIVDFIYQQHRLDRSDLGKFDVDGSKSSIDDKSQVDDKQMEKLYDELSGSEIDDIDVKEEDIKEVTPEQFMNVVDDTKKLIDEVKKSIKEEKSKSKTSKRSRTKKK